MVEEVFISSTSDMATFPADGKSFVDAATDAVVRAGRTPVDMSHFTARDSRPASYCRERVRGCPVYVVLVGLRYGSVVPGLDVSYTELEFDEATDAGAHRLVFLLNEDTPLPRKLIDGDPTRIDGFRKRLRHGGLVVKTFSSATDLDTLVYQALMELPSGAGGRHPDSATGPGGRAGAFAAARSSYLDRAVTRYRRLDLEALTPSEHDEHMPVLLQSVFVPQSVRADPPPVELSKELARRLTEAGEIDENDLPDGFDAQRLAQLRAAYTERPVLPVLDVVSDPGNRLLVLLGDPGAGKSTLARFLVLTLASGSAACALPGLGGWLPLLVELRVFADLRGECPTFLDFLHRMHEREGLGLPRDLLEWYLAEDGRALVVFDGLDELFNPKVREAVAREIGGFAARFPRVRVVVSSRVIGYRRPLLGDEGFAHYTLQDLDSAQVAAFVGRWYGVALHDRPTDAAERHDRLMRAVADSPSIRELAGNPLLLTILTIIGRRRELPRERRKVYEHAATVLVEQWDPNRHLQDASIQVGYITPDDRRQLLRRVAARMQAGRRGLAGNHIRGDELVEELAGYLAARYQLDPVAATTGARAILAQFRERNFILSRYGAEVYGFVHRAFLEYFCADKIVYCFQHTRELSPGNTQYVREAAVQAIAGGWHDHPDTLPLLHDRAAHDDTQDVREAAVQAIAGGWHDHPDTLALLHDRAAHDDDEDVRRAAKQAIDHIERWTRDTAGHDEDLIPVSDG